MQKGSVALIIILLVVLATASGGFYYWQNGQVDTPPPDTNLPADETAPTSNQPAPTPVNLASGAKLTFDKIKLGVEQNLPLASLAQYFTASSQQILSTPGFSLRCESMSYLSETEESGRIVIVGNCTDEDGDIERGYYVFSNEAGTWKLDFPATMQKMLGEPSQPSQGNNPAAASGYVDLKVLDIQIIPSPPKAGDRTVKIEARFINNGTKVFTGSANTKALIGTNPAHQQTGSFAGTINPGETKRFTISYSGYLLLSDDNSPGPKNVHFELDYDNKITESNEGNNAIDQVINFVP